MGRGEEGLGARPNINGVFSVIERFIVWYVHGFTIAQRASIHFIIYIQNVILKHSVTKNKHL